MVLSCIVGLLKAASSQESQLWRTDAFVYYNHAFNKFTN